MSVVAPLGTSLRNLKTDRIDIYRSHHPEETALESPIKHNRVTYSAMQVDLFKKWLFHCGAIDARELDLGTLTAIHDWVLKGFAPNEQGCKPYEVNPSAEQTSR